MSKNFLHERTEEAAILSIFALPNSSIANYLDGSLSFFPCFFVSISNYIGNFVWKMRFFHFLKFYFNDGIYYVKFVVAAFKGCLGLVIVQ